MKFIEKFFKRLWVIYYYFFFSLFFLLCYPFFYFFLSREKYYPVANKLRSFLSIILFYLSGLFYKIRFERKISHRHSYIFCPNHTSHLDIPLMCILLRKFNYVFMGKNELAKIPLFNIFFKTIDIPVDRKSRVKSFNALKEAEEDLEKGVNLVIFPEGTISEKAPDLLRFKNGAFILAIKKQVPVVPVTILDNWKLFLDDGKYIGRPGRTRVIVHHPVETKGMKEHDLERLKEKVFAIIDSTLKKEYESR